jgi:hypothetical protein
MYKIFLRNALFIVILSILCSNCISCRTKQGDLDPDRSIYKYPKISEKATIPITLQSNKNAIFFVDGAEIGRGKRLMVLVDQKPYSIAVKAEGFRSKEQNINPPYSADTTVQFLFMIGDRLK